MQNNTAQQKNSFYLMINLIPFFLISVLISAIALTSSFCWSETPLLFEGQTLKPLALSQIINSVQPGDILIVSEVHDFAPHSLHQQEVLHALNERPSLGESLAISVGLEFFPFTQQQAVDLYVLGNMQESEFLNQINWGKNNFDLYRQQALFSRTSSGKTLGLNIPRSLASAIKNKGIKGLSDEEALLLPPNFTLGNELYRQRFMEYMKGGHVTDPTQLDNFFQAQSAWDDAMAYQACQFIQSHPHEILVVIVGDFHAAYNGGLPDRLKARGCYQTKVISQVIVPDLSSTTQKDLLPGQYGVRAEWIWVTIDSNVSPKIRVNLDI